MPDPAPPERLVLVVRDAPGYYRPRPGDPPDAGYEKRVALWLKQGLRRWGIRCVSIRPQTKEEEPPK